MKRTVQSSSSQVGCATGHSEPGGSSATTVESISCRHTAWRDPLGSTGVAGPAGTGKGCAHCTTRGQAPGSNPTATSTNAEPRRSYSSLVPAQPSARPSRRAELPRVPPTLAAAALIAAELAACFCWALPSPLLPPHPVPSTCYLLSRALPSAAAAGNGSHRAARGPRGPWHAAPHPPQGLPRPATTIIVSKPGLFTHRAGG